MQNKVNCFLVGAQKSGSTALAGYLSQHKDIFLPTVKAPNFFNEKYKKSFQIKTLEEYHDLFSWKESYQVDSSDCYHSDFIALDNIKKYNPEAKIIMLLRNPEKMLASLHSHLLWAGYQDIQDINQAFKEQSKRSITLKKPETSSEESFLDYSTMCNIGEQVKYIIELFGRENVLFIPSQSLINTPQNVLSNAFKWLGLKDVTITLENTKSNKAVAPRFKFISKLNNKIPANFKTKVKLKASKHGLDFDGLMRTLNGKEIKQKSAPNFDAELIGFCLKQKRIVHDLTGIKL